MGQDRTNFSSTKFIVITGYEEHCLGCEITGHHPFAGSFGCRNPRFPERRFTSRPTRFPAIFQGGQRAASGWAEHHARERHGLNHGMHGRYPPRRTHRSLPLRRRPISHLCARRGQLPAQRNDGQSAYAPTRRTRLLDRHNDFTHFAQFFCNRWSRYHYRISNSIGNIELRRSFRNLL